MLNLMAIDFKIKFSLSSNMILCSLLLIVLWGYLSIIEVLKKAINVILEEIKFQIYILSFIVWFLLHYSLVNVSDKGIHIWVFDKNTVLFIELCFCCYIHLIYTFICKILINYFLNKILWLKVLPINFKNWF